MESSRDVELLQINNEEDATDISSLNKEEKEQWMNAGEQKWADGG